MSGDQILAAISGDGMPLTTARFAIRLAQVFGARLTVVSVVDEGALRELVASKVFVEQEAAEYARDIREEAQRLLDRIHEVASGRGVPCTCLLMSGVVYREVLEVATTISATMLVIGEVEQPFTRRDGWMSNGQRILTGARCPVVVVKNPRLVEQIASRV